MKEKTGGISQWVTFLLLCLFALCAAVAVLAGARVYRGVAQRGAAADDSRRAVRYLSTRIHQSQEPVEVGTFGENEALILRDQVDGQRYITRIYCYEGYLRELYTPEAGEFSPADGEKLFPLESLSFRESEALLRITVTLEEDYTLIFHKTGEVLP